MVYAFLGTLLVMGACRVFYASGKYVERQNIEERIQEALEQERLHRTNRLRDMGRVTDIRPDASGPPATSHGMRVIGTRPRSLDKPQTRM
jgi:hypothetical protein